jgi:hypothetical protein
MTRRSWVTRALWLWLSSVFLFIYYLLEAVLLVITLEAIQSRCRRG